MTIPEWPQSDEREAELLREVLTSPHWGGFHPFVREFEHSFAAYQHSKYCISAANGTLTLELALQLAGVGPGDEVILPAVSFISSATAISRVGALPVFVDIEEQSFNLGVQRVKEAITPQTKAVMAVHFGGVMCDVPAGSFGRIGSFSFQNGKVLTAGEGGALVTSDPSLAELARSLANCGRKEGCSFYEHFRIGTNFRMTAFQAAVLLCQLERLPAQIVKRTHNAALLKYLLRDVEAIAWQRIPAEQTQNPQYLLAGRLRDSDLDHRTFCAELTARQIPCAPFYPHTLYRNPVYQAGNCRVMPCPVAEARVRDGFWLNHRLLLAEEDTIHECAVIMRSAIVSRSLAKA
jgi:dTDP-4-amino-4,6-dideoxygalactose transaminase